MKVLVVDDHRYNRDLITFILEDDAYACLEAEDGVEAIEVFKEHSEIDLILMDINMPKMDGIDATRYIKEQFKERFVPIIFVTALDNEDVISKCLKVGGDDFLSKPVNENVLLAKIKAHLRTVESHRRLQELNHDLRFHRSLVEREREIVDKVFNNCFEDNPTLCKNINLYTSAAAMFNGDIALVRPSSSGGLYILVGDFTGHGLGAAIATLPVSEIFIKHVEMQSSISIMMAEINARLKALFPIGMFFCCTALHIDNTGTKASFWSGGMNDLLLLRQDDSSLERIEGNHMPCGILNDQDFDQRATTVSFPENAKVYLYTDGIVEATNDKCETFGLPRLENILIEYRGKVMDKILEEIKGFHLGRDRADDITVLEFSCNKIEFYTRNKEELVV